jgi:hypothetical protein
MRALQKSKDVVCINYMENKNLNSFPKNEITPRKESLEDFLKKSGLEHVPKIETTFFFNSHMTKEDGEKVVEFLKQGNFDIFAPEAAGWSEYQLDTMNQISKGTLKPEDFDNQRVLDGKESLKNDEYLWESLNGLYNQNKEIIIIDVPEDVLNSTFTGSIGEVKSDNFRLKLRLPFIDFEEAKKIVIENTSKYSNLQMQREDYVLENFYKTITDTLKRNPELQKKAKVNILASMGAFHTRLYNELKKNDNNVVKVYDQELPYVYDVGTALDRQMHFFGAENFEKYAHKYILNEILKTLKSTIDGSVLQKVITTFSENQTKELFELYKNKRLSKNCNEELEVWIKNELKI